MLYNVFVDEKEMKTLKIKEANNNIRKARLAVDISQEELAKRIGLTRPYISNLERGKQVPSAYLSNRLAEALNTTSEYLFPVQNVNNELHAQEKDKEASS